MSNFLLSTVITLSIEIDRPLQTVQTQNAAYEQGLHCLPYMQQYLDTSRRSKLEYFKF